MACCSAFLVYECVILLFVLSFAIIKIILTENIQFNHTDKLQYRADLDGLRAVAVISVVLFHLNPAYLPGGFIGVDIFFVISGYLITRIILHDMACSQFTFAGFYLRRIKRILPPLWPVIFFTLTISAFLFSKDSFVDLLFASLSSSVFFANHYFASQYNYFGSPGEHTPLLHLWSLSVEEQFYLLWPCLLFFAFKLGIKKTVLLFILILAMALSFFGATLMASVESYEKAAFYLLPPRAGELLIGVCLALAAVGSRPEKIAAVFRWSGLIIILLSFFLLNNSSIFPGLNAVWPCLGAALIILGNSEQQTTNVLTNRVSIYIGKISYSLYLWHWPMLSLPRYIMGELSTIQALTLLGFAWLFADISWRFIESPVRKSGINFIKAISFFWIIPALIILIIYILCKFFIFENKPHDLNNQHLLELGYCAQQRLDTGCVIGDKQFVTRSLMFGDSHAGHYFPFMDDLGKRFGFSVEASCVQSCYPLLDIGNVLPSKDSNIMDKVNCVPHLNYINKNIHKYDIIILAAAWTNYVDGANRAPDEFDFIEQLDVQVSKLIENGEQVILIAQVPWYKNRSVEAYNNIYAIPVDWIRISLLQAKKTQNFAKRDEVNRVNNLIKKIAEKYEEAHYVDPMQKWNLSSDAPFLSNRMLYINSDHLSFLGSSSLAKENNNPAIRKLAGILAP